MEAGRFHVDSHLVVRRLCFISPIHDLPTVHRAMLPFDRRFCYFAFSCDICFCLPSTPTHLSSPSFRNELKKRPQETSQFHYYI